MANFDLLRGIPEPNGILRTPKKLMQLGELVLRNASTIRNRKSFRLEKTEPTESADGKFEFPTIIWDRFYAQDIHFTLVDKRRADAGFLLTAYGPSNQPEHTAAQAYVFNNSSLLYRGLRRIKNDIYADDVCGSFLDAQHGSVVRERLEVKPEEVQFVDFSKAISTALG